MVTRLQSEGMKPYNFNPLPTNSKQDQSKIWSWFAGTDKPGVFEIDWQIHSVDKVDRIAMALECRSVGVIDIQRIPTITDSIH